jgi:hypothetical protein
MKVKYVGRCGKTGNIWGKIAANEKRGVASTDLVTTDFNPLLNKSK